MTSNYAASGDMMQAVVMRHGTLQVESVPVPTPGPREVLVKVLATGICGSDLHCLAHTEQMVSSTKIVTGNDLFDLDEPVVMGHEFCAEVVAYGPESRGTIAPGTRVASPGFLLRDPLVLIGYAGLTIPGGYAEYILLSEDLLVPVPDGMSDEIAALAEPLSVALHAVNRGNLGDNDVPLVIGCGPIGLAIIAVLKARGHGPIVAADYSPSRRELATRLGADIVVDPRETSPYDAWREQGVTEDPALMARPNGLFPPGLRPATIFECVGVPGMLEQVFTGMPPCSKVVVAGVCMEPDSYLPVVAVLKEIDVIYSIAFTPEEYVEVIGLLASGKLDVSALVTDRITLDEVPAAFKRLATPDADAKIMVLPGAAR